MNKEIHKHLGHDLIVASYGQGDDTYNVALECETCWSVVFDKDVDSSEEAADLAESYRNEAGIV